MSNDIVSVPLTNLSMDDAITNLVPGMTDEEWKDFFTSCKRDGIRQPIDVRDDGVILDGRHRYKAAIKLHMESIKVIYHKLTKEQSIEFVRDTAVNRRNLTPVQKADVMLKSEDIINELEQAAKKRQAEYHGNRFDSKKVDFSSREEKSKSSKINNTEQIGKMAGLSGTSVSRMKKIKRESPDKYQEVVSGTKPIKTAYKELPSVQAHKKVVPLVPEKPVNVNDYSVDYTGMTPTEVAKYKSIKDPAQRHFDWLNHKSHKVEQPKTTADNVVANIKMAVENFTGTISVLGLNATDQVVAEGIKEFPQKYPDLVSRLDGALKKLNLKI